MNIAQINQTVFARLGSEKQLVEYHDILLKMMGLVADFINCDGVSLRLSKMKHFNPYCTRLRNTANGFAACEACDRRNAGAATKLRVPSVYRCYAGLTEVVVPLYDHSGHYVGCMTSGQFHVEEEPRASQEEIGETARRYGLDPEEMVRFYQETPVLHRIQLEGVIEFLQAVGRIIAGEHNRLLFMENIDVPDRITRVQEFVEKNYMLRLSIDKVARRFYLSPDYFSACFRREIGITFTTYLNIFRVNKAQELIRETELSMAEIATLCGFGSLSQFNRLFRSVAGKSPRAYRNTPS